MSPSTPAVFTEADIARLVDAFYEQVRADPALGAVFHPVVHDWAAHKATLVRFWSSVLMKTASYRGQPMAMHRPLSIDTGHFQRWLALWRETAHQVLSPAQADAVCDHAARIARSLMFGLGLDPERRPIGLPMAG